MTTVELDGVQQRILGELDEQGYSLLTFGELFPDPLHWRDVEAMRDRFIADTEADLAAGGEHVRVRVGKEFVVRMHSYGVDVGLDDPWFRACASRTMLDIANALPAQWSKLEYLDVWYSVPQPATGEQVSSQLWHRDYNDKHLLKAFLTSSTSTRTWARSSTSASPAAGTRTPGPGARSTELPVGGGARATDPRLGRANVHRPGALLLFCNTAGFHRGGFSTSAPAYSRP